METGRDFYHREIGPGLVGAAVLETNPNGAAPRLVALNLGGASTPGVVSTGLVRAYLPRGQTVMIPNGFVLQVTK
jgi:hypothetical protein